MARCTAKAKTTGKSCKQPAEQGGKVCRFQTPTKPDSSAHARGWMAAFLVGLSQTCNVTWAAETANINRATAYEWRDKDEAFAAAWDEALEEGYDRLEREAWRRAVEGVDEPVYQRGEQVGVIRRYSDTLMQTLLKAHRPDKYRDRSSLDVTSGGETCR